MTLEANGIVAVSEPMPEGGGHIIGNPVLTGRLSLPSLLVRETVQNTWDARDDERGDGPVLFDIQGWDLDAAESDHLKSLLPVGGLQGFRRKSDADEGTGPLHPQAVLDRQGLKVLVISDRNTVGLCGPTRSGRQWNPVRNGQPLPRGQQRFANFVRNSGRAATDTGKGDGGAFGVGKSALWMSSECGTVLIHSRTSDEQGEPAERFIGSIWGNHFYEGGKEYTGRHFLGVQLDGVVEPLVGSAAAAAIKGLPIPPYEVDGKAVCGTTVIIVAPRLHLDWNTEMFRLRDAIRWHVWPKLVPSARGAGVGPDMSVRLAWNGNGVNIPEPLADPEIRPYALALQHCGLNRDDEEPNRDFQLWCRRPRKMLGDLKFREAGVSDANVFHVTLTKQALGAATDPAEQSELLDIDPVIEFDAPWGQVALIRREPLLLVRYEAISGPADTQTFVGVLLSAEDSEVEEALTKAEPPAHDDWTDKNVPRDHSRDHRGTYVRRILAELKRAINEFTNEFRQRDEGHSGRGEQALSRLISEKLLGGLGGSPAPRQPGPGGGPSVGRPGARLEVVRSQQEADGTLHELKVTMRGLGNEPRLVELHASAKGVDDTGTMAMDGLVSFMWVGPDGSVTSSESLVVAASDLSTFDLAVRVNGDVRVRPKVAVKVAADA